ncbi:hypothetical protein J0895_01915 [Phormidium pseudopriestleyi FRX01]|uniref:Uncharacterized protein n=1 Tax=Phormidium pseudopriestleyi FRX01 TaxID=1759528 RepID=A0ABS3FL94_9CYAN|nr:hypothetical protein [Phormidium pseudopriestleyi]MBO0347883.1 hypothetical protein [Phormidium pseudopriestleyi FRX01]
MLRALQQTVKVGTGGKIELIVPECPEGTEVQVIVLLSNSNQGLKSTISPEIESETTASFQSSLKKIQNKIRQYVPEGESLVDELIAERRAEANRE